MKLGLQVILGILSLIPLLVSILGVAVGLGRWLPAEMITAEFDSHYRYLTGYYLSLTAIAWWMIPSIEKHTTLFRFIGGGIFFGGVGRVMSMIQVGAPRPMSIFFTVLELSFPLLMVWQTWLARRSRA